MAHIQCAKIIPGPRFEVFSFMTSPENLAAQLGGLINVRWQNPGIEMAPGSEYLFLMERFGIEQPIRYTVEKYVLGYSLTYRQVSGIFNSFLHTIKFDEHRPNQTLVTDFVEYELPFGLVGRIADDFLVKQDMTRILNYRLNFVANHFLKLKTEPVAIHPEG